MLIAVLLLAPAPVEDPPLPQVGGATVAWSDYAVWLIAERGERRLGELALQRALLARARAAGLAQLDERAPASELARRVAAAERVVDEATVRAERERRRGAGRDAPPLAAVREELERAPASTTETDALIAEVWSALDLRALPALLDPRAGLDAPAAELSGELLTRDALARWVAEAEGRALVFAYCREHVTRAAARAAGLEVAPGRVAARAQEFEVAERVRLGGGDEARWRAALARHGEGTSQARRRLARRAELELLQDAIVSRTRVITEADVHALWEERHGPSGRDLVVRVLVRTADPARDVPRELEELAQRVRDGADFRALVARESDDPYTREQGGAPPLRFPYEELEEPLRARLERGRVGDLVGPVHYARLPWTPRIARRVETAWRDPDEAVERRGYHALLQLVADVRTPLTDVEDALHAELAARAPDATERARWTQAELRRVGWGSVDR